MRISDWSSDVCSSDLLVALIVPDTDFAAEWARRRGRSPQSLADDPDFERALAAAVDRVGRQLAVVERVRRFIIAPGGFTVENNMLTPSLKIRRHIIREAYRDRLEARSEEHTSELQSLMRIPYAVF